MSIPNTFIIGVEKAGTSSLHFWLSQHPDVYGPTEFKDVDIFCHYENENLIRKKCKEYYNGNTNESIILHSHVNYLLFEDALIRLKNISPDSKLIIVYRDPVERAISAYNFNKKMNREKRNIKDALIYTPIKSEKYVRGQRNFFYIERGLYARQIERLFQYFDKKQILILPFSELEINPEKLIKETFAFLNIDSSFIPQLKKKNITGTPRFIWLQKLITSKQNNRKLYFKLFHILTTKKTRRKLKYFLIENNTVNKKNGVIDDQIREHLSGYFNVDYEVFLNNYR